MVRRWGWKKLIRGWSNQLLWFSWAGSWLGLMSPGVVGAGRRPMAGRTPRLMCGTVDLRGPDTPHPSLGQFPQYLKQVISGYYVIFSRTIGKSDYVAESLIGCKTQWKTWRAGERRGRWRSGWCASAGRQEGTPSLRRYLWWGSVASLILVLQ